MRLKVQAGMFLRVAAQINGLNSAIQFGAIFEQPNGVAVPMRLTLSTSLGFSRIVPLYDGFLCGLSLSLDDTSGTGGIPNECAGSVELWNGVDTSSGNKLATLCVGPFSVGRGLVAGAMRQPNRQDIPLEYLTVTQPAAGAEFTFALQPGWGFEFVGVSATLVTSAAVATRQAGLAMMIGGQVAARTFATDTQTASVTKRYCWMRGHPVRASLATATPQHSENPWPNIDNVNGGSFTSSTVALDVGDQWSEILVLHKTALDF